MCDTRKAETDALKAEIESTRIAEISTAREQTGKKTTAVPRI